jgi:hypothetical protein
MCGSPRRGAGRAGAQSVDPTVGGGAAPGSDPYGLIASSAVWSSPHIAVCASQSVTQSRPGPWRGQPAPKWLGPGYTFFALPLVVLMVSVLIARTQTDAWAPVGAGRRWKTGRAVGVGRVPEQPAGHLRLLPVAWTDLVPRPAALVVGGAGRHSRAGLRLTRARAAL